MDTMRNIRLDVMETTYWVRAIKGKVSKNVLRPLFVVFVFVLLFGVFVCFEEMELKSEAKGPTKTTKRKEYGMKRGPRAAKTRTGNKMWGK